LTRTDHIQRVLAEFRASCPATAPLATETVWHRSWTARDAGAFNRKSGWKKATGVYLFVDFCTENDIHGESTDERFSAIRRIGKADYRFADRISDYCHTVSGEPGARFSWAWWHGCWQQWFRYSQIDIVRIDRAIAPSLEAFLLCRIPTECNDKATPVSLKGRPIIYDAQSAREVDLGC
jgi:hypothetical protein